MNLWGYAADRQGRMKKINDNTFFVYTKLKRKNRTEEDFLKLMFKSEKFYDKIIGYATIKVN